jgi:hypothetical protein
LPKYHTIFGPGFFCILRSEGISHVIIARYTHSSVPELSGVYHQPKEINVKKQILLTAILLVGTVPLARAGNVGVGLNINIGNQPGGVVSIPVPVTPVAPPIVMEEPPDFVSPPSLGFYVAVGVPYDLYFVGNNYYTCKENVWYRSPRFNGPWDVVRYRAIPPGLRKHRLEKIRYFRDEEYRAYRKGADHYRGRHFRPGKEQREDKRWAKDDRKWDGEEHRHDEGRHGRHGGRD